ncbi:unnamed protein product [Scytosiphon promiscuus]
MPGYNDRASILKGAEEMIFKLVCDRATPEQWAEWLRAPLEHAAGTGNHDLVSRLLSAGANGSAGWRGCHAKTLLHAGAEGGNETVMETLIWKCGEDKNTRAYKDGSTPLHYAVRSGKQAIVKMLVMARVDVNIRDGNGDGPLHLAINNGHVELAEMLLLGGADPNKSGSCGSYPIHMATRLGQNEVVRALVQSGANLNYTNTICETCLSIAVGEERVSTVKLLLAAGADPDSTMASPSRQQTVLHLAARSNKVAAIPALIKAGATIDAFDVAPKTPLFIAVWFGSCAAVLTLLQLGAKVDKRCRGKQLTPLHAACSRGNPDAADLLLRWGADETATDAEGEAPSSKMQAIVTADEEDRPKLERLAKLLERAPQDRAWRRRGFLLVCRAYPDRVRLGSKADDTTASSNRQSLERPPCRARRGRGENDESGGTPGGSAEGGRGDALGAGRAERESGGGGFERVAAWLMALTDEDALRKIVTFL